MKTVTAAAQTHLDQDTTTLATCWRLTRTDEVVMGFTDHQHDLTVSGVLYRAQTGLIKTVALNSTSNLSVDNTDVEVSLAELNIQGLVREDLLAGRYDFAELLVFICNYQDPDAWQTVLSRGYLGEVTVGHATAQVEMRSLTQLLKQRIGRTHEIDCSYELGETRCGVDLGLFTVTGAITQKLGQALIEDTSRTEADGWFTGGKITFTSGLNAGLSMAVKRWVAASSQFQLSLPMPYPLEVGDTYEVHAGCDKRWPTCRDKFNNTRFSGFPFIPGTDFLFSGPDIPGGV